MSKITRLTKEQEKKIPIYVDKWIKIGIDTTPITLSKTRSIINPFYKKILNKKNPKCILIMDNPIHSWFAIFICLYLFGNQVRNQVRNQVENQVWNQVKNQVENQVENQVRNQVKNFIWPYLDGNFYSSYFSFYDFFFSENIIKCSNELWNIYLETAKLSLIYPFETFCICCQKPSKISMKNNRLHCDTGPAIEYKGGFKIWNLNGINVPQEIVETPASGLDCHLILKEKNIEIRKEIVRKIGIERISKELTKKILDQNDNYVLFNLDLGDGRERPYLKMLNPSTGSWHIEGVSPEIKSVEEALNWRNNTKEIPVIIT